MNCSSFVVLLPLFDYAECLDNVVVVAADDRRQQQLQQLVDERPMKRMRPHGDDDMQFELLHKQPRQHLLAHIVVQVELLVLILESQTYKHTSFHELSALCSCHNNNVELDLVCHNSYLVCSFFRPIFEQPHLDLTI